MEKKQRTVGVKYIGLSLSNKCNYTCRHCVFNCGPDGESLTMEQIKKIIDHFPDDIRLLTISGGEPFVVPELLYGCLEYLKEKKFKHLKSITIETNGFWARDEESIKKTLNKLLEFGFKINLTIGMSKYHQECGQDIKRALMIKKIAEQSFGKENSPFQFYIHCAEAGKVKKILGTYFILSVGRARRKVRRFMCWGHFLIKLVGGCASETIGIKGHFDPEQYWLLIDYKGEVYGCCWRMHKGLGNAIETPIIELLQNAQRDPYFKALNEGGIKKAALLLGFSKEKIKQRTKWGRDCEFCEEIHNQSID